MNARKQCDSVNDASVVNCHLSVLLLLLHFQYSQTLSFSFNALVHSHSCCREKKQNIHRLIPRHQGTDEVSDSLLNGEEDLSAIDSFYNFLILKNWEKLH